VCSFDCLYCSLGPITEKTIERRTFIDTGQVEKELKGTVGKVEADVVTFSGTGEPTLAQNLGEAIKVAREISGLPVAVLTNSSLKTRKDVRRDLAGADIVVGELDAPNEELFKKINQSHEEVLFGDVIKGLKKFREEFKGRFSLEVMFIPENKGVSKEIAEIARTIRPDEVQVNTPLRPSLVRPLTPEELGEVQESFEGMNFRSVYQAKKLKVKKTVGREKLRQLKRPGRETNSITD
jgi:wyosine [tRNA(Phe)-imidazoG37] synthetase (radical SAM superfamily)